MPQMTVAVAIFALLAAALCMLPGFAPPVAAGDLTTAQIGGRFSGRIVDKDCTNQTWPNYSTLCLSGDSAKLATRRVGSDRS